MSQPTDGPIPGGVRALPAPPAPPSRPTVQAAVDRTAPAASDAVRNVLARVQAAVRMRHYSRRTEKAYVGWIRRYITYHHGRDPASLEAAEVKDFLARLAVDGRVSASTQNQAFSALLFLYRDVLGT